MDMLATTVKTVETCLTQNACDAEELASLLPPRFSSPLTTPSTAAATTYFPAALTTPSQVPHNGLSIRSHKTPSISPSYNSFNAVPCCLTLHLEFLQHLIV